MKEEELTKRTRVLEVKTLLECERDENEYLEQFFREILRVPGNSSSINKPRFTIDEEGKVELE